MTDFTPTADSEQYEFRGVPLTPAVFGTIARTLFAGQTPRRAAIIEAVSAAHMASGGLPANGNVTSLSKKALRDLVDAGEIEQTGAGGYYRFPGEQDQPEIQDAPEAAVPATYSGGFVYAYYLPAYAELAAARGDKSWPHKVGMTTTTVEDRIAQQVGTAIPETPVVARTWKTDTPLLLERAIHSVLELRGQKVAAAVGTEWFVTNGDELDVIVEFMQPND